MQCSVTIVVELEAEAGISQMEATIREAGRRVMRDALEQAVRSYEVTYAACLHCGGALHKVIRAARPGRAHCAVPDLR